MKEYGTEYKKQNCHYPTPTHKRELFSKVFKDDWMNLEYLAGIEPKDDMAFPGISFRFQDDGLS